MAIYKPSNFYPHLQEVDLTKINGNIFSCQVNTDGSFVSGARLNIYTEDNVLVYDNLYQFANAEEVRNNPIENRGFAELLVEPYSINGKFNFEASSTTSIYYRRVNVGTDDFPEYIYYNEYGDGGKKIEFTTKDEAEEITEIIDVDGNIHTDIIDTEVITTITDNRFTISEISFLSLLVDDINIDELSYCPYNLYNVKMKDSLCFGLKIEAKDKTVSYLYPLKNVVECESGNGNGFNITFGIPYNETDNADGGIFNILSKSLDNHNFYIVLLNDKDYLWDVKFYEHMFNEENINNGTLITDGYITGSTKSVLWWDSDKQSKNTLFNKKEIKEDYYVEVVADENNSDLFENQIKMGRKTQGVLSKECIDNEKNCFKFTENLVDIEMYKIENLFLYVEFINYIPDDNRIKAINYLKIKKMIKDLDVTYIELEDGIAQNLIFNCLNTDSSPKTNFSIVYKQREKITWITENLGFNKNINKIELENDLDVNLKDGTLISIYGGNNINTSYSFFGVRDSDLNVNDIYVRFPGYRGADFNGNPINDNLKYYEEKGEAEDIYEKGASKPLELISKEGLKGSFYNGGTFYKTSESTNPIDWSQQDYQPIALYGKNVSYKNFENNTETITYGYFDIFNPEAIGTSSCNTGFSITIYDSRGDASIFIDGDENYYSYIPETSANGTKVKGTLYFYIQDDEWYMYATMSSWSSTSYSSQTWQFKDYPNITRHDNSYLSPSLDEQKKKKYKIGKINDISIDFFKDRGDDESQWFEIKYYDTDGPDFGEAKTSEVTILDGNGQAEYYCYPKIAKIPASYCKLFKVTNYDYETGEFVIAGGLERSILNTDRYEVWQRTVSENMTNEYNITEIMYSYTRLYPPHDKYDDVAYVGDTKILRDGIKIMNNTDKQIFIQPNVNFESDQYNYPYLILDNYNEKIEFPYKYKIYDEGFTIQDRTINKLDGSQWLLEYTGNLNMIPKSGLTYKLYMDTCRSVPANWFYGRNIVNIDMHVGEYNFIMSKINNEYKPVTFYDKKKDFKRMESEKIGDYCIIRCVDAYFMATYENLSVPIKRYRYRIYDSNMKLISDSDYVYNNNVNYAVRGLRNYENYLLEFELEDQLGYVYTYTQKFTVKYIEWEVDNIQIDLTVKESQGCVIGDFVVMREVIDDSGIVLNRDTYDEDGNKISKGTLIPKGTIYADLAKIQDFYNFGLIDTDSLYVYRRDTNKLLFPVCNIHLSKNKIITGKNDAHKYGFIDYGVRNNEYYDYVVVLKQQDSGSRENHQTNMTYWYTENRCRTQFNGWLLVDIEKNDADRKYYVSDFVWNFKYNLESQDLTQNTSVVQWNNLGRYANTYIGERDFISSGLTCLLGDVGTYFTYDGENIHEKFGYFELPYSVVNYDDIYNIYATEVLTNNIDKYLEWKTFVKNGNPKLLKDYKGNAWIVQILENPSAKNNDVSNEQIYTVSFNWVEIDDWKKYSILGKNISYNVDESVVSDLKNIYFPMWNIEYNADDLTYTLKSLDSNHKGWETYSSFDTPLLINGILSISSNTLYGTLNEGYTYDVDDNGVFTNINKYFSEYPIDDVDKVYENIKNIKNINWISPFMVSSMEGDLEYPEVLNYIDFEQDLKYQNSSIDFLCCNMNNLQGVNIVLTDTIKTARYAFAGTNISTDNKYKITISTNNYIDTRGIFDDIEFSNGGSITVTWNESVDDPNLLLYAELYEQYWNNDKIILNCPKLKFVLDEYDYAVSEDGKTIILNYYKGPISNSNIKTSIYIPSNVKVDLKNGNGKKEYQIILASDFYLAK